jgi:hypothetical protein
MIHRFTPSDSCYSLDREYPPASQSYFPMQPMAFEQQQYQQHQQQVNDLYYQRKPQEERTMARQQEYQQTITYLQARALHNRRQQANRTPGTRNSAKRQQRQMSQQARSMVQPPQLQRVQMRSNSLTAIPNDMKAWEPNISNQPLSYTSMQSNVDSVQRYIPMIEADPVSVSVVHDKSDIINCSSCSRTLTSTNGSPSTITTYRNRRGRYGPQNHISKAKGSSRRRVSGCRGRSINSRQPSNGLE